MPTIHSRKIAASISVSRQRIAATPGKRAVRSRMLSCGMKATVASVSVSRL
jgi:hypothetical protein